MTPKQIVNFFCLTILLITICQGCVSQQLNDERYGSKFRPIPLGSDIQDHGTAKGVSIIIGRITVDRSLYKAKDEDVVGPQRWQWAWLPPLNFYDENWLIAGKSPSVRYESEWSNWFPTDAYHQGLKERLIKMVSNGYNGVFFDTAEPGTYILASEKHEITRKGIVVKTFGGKEVSIPRQSRGFTQCN